MKKQSNLSRLMGYAGGHKILTYLSWVLSVMSALLALVPFWYIWCIIHDILEAVSYTHLDVYKRQLRHFRLLWFSWHHTLTRQQL